MTEPLIAVPDETRAGETRVALTPDAARRTGGGRRYRLQAGAGAAASFEDEAYRDVGVEVVAGHEAVHEGADAVLRVGPPRAREGGHEADAIPEGALLLGMLDPHREGELLSRLANRGVTALSLELLPRITRAQSMDALSAMATAAGYKAALLGADSLIKFFPMLTTAAGTIRPATVLVLGAGVAGLQAIATARRLGARVEAFDIRPEVKEQVESLGATFLEWEDDSGEGAATADGYATAVSEETERREREMVARHAADADVIITTAQVPGGNAPTLVDAATVEAMRRGSVIVDLAGASGGNCEVSRPGETVEHAGVTVYAPLNLPAALPFHASQMYARNVTSLLEHVTADDGSLAIDLDDEIVDAVCVTHRGEVRFSP